MWFLPSFQKTDESYQKSGPPIRKNRFDERFGHSGKLLLSDGQAGKAKAKKPKEQPIKKAGRVSHDGRKIQRGYGRQIETLLHAASLLSAQFTIIITLKQTSSIGKKRKNNIYTMVKKAPYY